MTTPTREPRRYGQWAGNPKGSLERPDLCIEEVRERDGWYHYQCSRPRGYGTDGLYCKQHDPETIKARREAASLASKKRQDAAWYVCRKPEHAAFDALLAAAKNILAIIERDYVHGIPGQTRLQEAIAQAKQQEEVAP